MPKCFPKHHITVACVPLFSTSVVQVRDAQVYRECPWLKDLLMEIEPEFFQPSGRDANHFATAAGLCTVLGAHHVRGQYGDTRSFKDMEISSWTSRISSSGTVLRVTVIWLALVTNTRGWHGIGNEDYHCWPLSADAASPVPYDSCPGVDVDWVVAPPGEVKAEAAFNVTYSLLIIPSLFYTWADSKGIFDQAGTSGGFSNDPTGARQWCETTQCPADVTQATQENCCVHHVNVHSCPMAQTDLVTNGLCGPWIPPSGAIFTHSQVLVGPVDTVNWTSSIDGLYEVGLTSVIAHFKLAGMHIAIEKKVEVLPKTVCGDGVCEEEGEEETCDKCPKDCGNCPLQGYEIGLIVGGLFIVLVIIVSILLYFRRQRTKLLWDESWIVAAEEIDTSRGDGGQFGSRLMGSCLDLSSTNQGNTNDNSSSIGGGGGALASEAIHRQVFMAVAYVSVKGRQMAVRKIHNSRFHLTKKIRSEVRDVRSLDHPNLCRFLGGCVEQDRVCILTEYCPKGSLMDVLQNDAIPLSWAFRFSLVTDVARGMAHLHKHKMVHGNLKSNNCVIDDRWTCKVTDYGLTEFRRESDTTDSNPDLQQERQRREMRSRVYRAPETRRNPSPVVLPASDVYSFAVILVEVASGDDAYGEANADELPDDWKPPLPQYQPDDPPKDADYVCPAPHHYTRLIVDCWANKVEERPTFEMVKKTLQRINPNKLGPVDTMMANMEKYSRHLEAVVNERTKMLVEEKRRADQLLDNMLPPPVAELLKKNMPVEAEQFEACTIYFSDIVGFTTISGKSTPMEVVSMLNSLYTTFDSIIAQHSVYKVETIGDAYMVVSGVPTRNPHHARHVARMSLDMVAASRRFRIPHMPDEPLCIRVGLHSGPVCAGVVGMAMPRYCLFGDTVNTASRMESNGEAYKIHISNSTYVELQKEGGFVCERRGTIQVKGKGDMVTWWLIKTEEEKEEKGKEEEKESPITTPSLSLATECRKEGDGDRDRDSVDIMIQELIHSRDHARSRGDLGGLGSLLE
ncbi:LOW QUALITY PROTEIN: atrial natriuretic peptide receptor 1-like [Babylonia areolata]|uniref:LOW QUALITY PROTEIN: atrial natriuretic peptide receptor 1-like n=1 Tax=Babylonia areolata TaxID=304850 RepID=UPI003FD11D58